MGKDQENTHDTFEGIHFCGFVLIWKWHFTSCCQTCIIMILHIADLLYTADVVYRISSQLPRSWPAPSLWTLSMSMTSLWALSKITLNPLNLSLLGYLLVWVPTCFLWHPGRGVNWCCWTLGPLSHNLLRHYFIRLSWFPLISIHVPPPPFTSSPFLIPDALVILLPQSVHTDTHTVPHLLSASHSGESLHHWVLPVIPPGPAAQTHGLPHDAEPSG